MKPRLKLRTLPDGPWKKTVTGHSDTEGFRSTMLGNTPPRVGGVTDENPSVKSTTLLFWGQSPECSNQRVLIRT